MANLSEKKIKGMSAAEVRQACKKAGIETKGKKLPQLREALIAAQGEGEKSSKKPGKKKAPPKAEAAAKGGGKGKKSKGKSKAEPEPEPEPEEQTESVDLEALEKSVFDKIIAVLTPKMRDIEKRVKALEESSTDAPDDDDDGGDDAPAEIPESLSEFVDEDGDLNLDPDDVDGMKGKTLNDLAAVLGVEFPDDAKNVRAKRSFLKETLEERNGGDDEDEGGEDEDEDEDEDEEDIELIEGPDGETAQKCNDYSDVSVEDEVYIATDGEWFRGTVVSRDKDDDGDEYIHVKCDDGDDAHVYAPEVNDDPVIVGWTYDEEDEDEDE